MRRQLDAEEIVALRITQARESASALRRANPRVIQSARDGRTKRNLDGEAKKKRYRKSITKRLKFLLLKNYIFSRNTNRMRRQIKKRKIRGYNCDLFCRFVSCRISVAIVFLSNVAALKGDAFIFYFVLAIIGSILAGSAAK